MPIAATKNRPPPPRRHPGQSAVLTRVRRWYATRRFDRPPPRRGDLDRMAEVDLDEGVLHVRDTRADEDDDPDVPKSQPGDRTVPLDAVTVAVLRAWRKRQADERLAWARAGRTPGWCSPACREWHGTVYAMGVGPVRVPRLPIGPAGQFGLQLPSPPAPQCLVHPLACVLRLERGHVGVALRCRNPGMAEDLLHKADVVLDYSNLGSYARNWRLRRAGSSMLRVPGGALQARRHD